MVIDENLILDGGAIDISCASYHDISYMNNCLKDIMATVAYLTLLVNQSLSHWHIANI